MKRSFMLAIVSALLLTLSVASASAQATRTWVSGVGDDVNPCSRTAPCKTFAGAISKTLTAGEINCLDPAGFGAVTITKSITIKCDPMSNGGVVVQGTNGIVVSAPAGSVVHLLGLDLEGVGSGLNGVLINSASTVYIINCTIRDFATNGVFVNSTINPTRVVIKDSIISNNGTGGTTAGGINVQGNGAPNGVDIFNTDVDGNKNFAVQATGTNSSLGIARSYFGGSPIALNLVSGAAANSFGPSNVMRGTINGTPTSVAYQ